MDLDLLLTLLGGFGANIAILWRMNTKIEKINREFITCPHHREVSIDE